MTVSYEDFINRYGINSQNNQSDSTYEDFINKYGNRKPNEASAQSTFTPEEVQHYQGIINEPPKERFKVQPKEAERIADRMRQKHPELKNFSNEQVLDIYHEMGRHKGRHLGESLAKGVIGVADIPQQLASLATLGSYKPEEYPSQAIQRFLKEKDIVDLNKERALTPSEKIIGTAAEWTSSALSGAGVGKAALGVISPVAKAAKGIPYAGKVARGVEKGTEIAYGVPQNARELAKYTGIAGGLGATSGALQSYAGLSPEQASMVGFAPLAAGIAKGVSNILRGIIEANPVNAGKREAQIPLREFEQAEAAIPKSLEFVHKLPEKPESFIPLGKNIRGEMENTLGSLYSERKPIIQEYEAAKKLPDVLRPKNALKTIYEERKLLRGGSDYHKLLGQIRENLHPKGKSKEGLPIYQINEEISNLSDKAASAFKAGENKKGNFYNKVISALNKDLEAHPEFASRRAAYASAMEPINKIENHPVFSRILKKTDYKVSDVIGDSMIPEKVIDMSSSGESLMKDLMDIVGKNPKIMEQIKNYNKTRLINSITNEKGHVKLGKLHNFTKNNPGIFELDPFLKPKLKNVTNAQTYYNRLLKELRSEKAKDISLLHSLGEKALVGGALGAMAKGIPGAGIAGAVATGAGLYKNIKSKAYQQAIKKALDERGQ